MSESSPISVLLLDDNPPLLAMYKRQIEASGPFLVTAETNSTRARALALRQLFDVVVIDAKLEYRGLEYGGLRLADDLRPRYGNNSILIISRFLKRDHLREFEETCEFMEKYDDDETGSFIADLCRKIRRMQEAQYAFVAMPFGSSFTPLYEQHLHPGVQRAGLKCVRADTVAHNRHIVEVLFELIHKCKLVLFLADGGNANAYYEAGFATALGKEVIVVARNLGELKFDIAGKHTITYAEQPETLKEQLSRKLVAMRLASPVGT